MRIGERTGKLPCRTVRYVSDFEQFLEQHIASHTTVAPARQRGWQLCRDHRVELADLAVPLADAVPVKGHAYD